MLTTSLAGRAVFTTNLGTKPMGMFFGNSGIPPTQKRRFSDAPTRRNDLENRGTIKVRPSHSLR